MDLIPGVTLREVARSLSYETQESKDTRERVARVVRLIRSLSRTLGSIHDQGIVHGDVSPSNIIVRPDDAPVLIDFGASLYAFVDGVPREAAQIEGRRHGTPLYMAPEQIRGDVVDARCDLYALGCVFFELLTGRPPFAGVHPEHVQKQHLDLEPPKPSLFAAGISASLDRLILSLLKKEPRRRMGFARDVAAALDLSRAPDVAAQDAPQTGRHLYRSRSFGRDAVLQSLTARCGDAAKGHGAFIAITGEGGAGKTRILNEVIRVVSSQRSHISIGNCTGGSDGIDSRTTPPLAPLLPLARLAFDASVHEPRLREDEQLGSAFAALVPYDATLSPPAVHLALEPLPPELARERVFQAVRYCVRVLAKKGPLAVVIDDLQWADDLTRTFLLSSWTTRELRSLSVLVVVAYREDEADPSFARSVSALASETLRVLPLERDELAAMIRDMTASAVLGEGVVDDVFRESGGNPFLSADVLRTGIDTGRFRRHADGRLSKSEASDDLTGAPGAQPARAHIALRIGRLTEGARRVAELAALLGGAFDEQLLATLFGAQDPNEVRSGLDELAWRHIVVQSAQGSFQFVHERVRSSCEELVDIDRRRVLHRAAAEGLECHHPDAPRPPAVLSRLARHWAGASECIRASRYYEDAGLAFEAVHAYGEAAESYKGALAQLVLATTDGAVCSMRARIAEALGDLLTRQAMHDDARRHYALALERSECNSELVRARLLRKTGHSYWTVHRYDEAADALGGAQRLLELLAPADQSREREAIEVYQNAFWTAYFARRIGEETDRLLSALAASTARCGTLRQRAMFHQCATSAALARARFRSTDVIIDQARVALELLERSPEDVLYAVEARFDLAFALVNSGVEDCREAPRMFESCAAMAARLGDSTNRARALAYLAVAHRRLRDLEGTREAAARARDAAEEAQLVPYLGVAAASLAWVAWQHSECVDDHAFANAATLVEDARRWWSGGHVFPFRWLGEFVRFGMCVAADDREGAREAAACLVAPDQQQLPTELDQRVSEVARLEELDTADTSRRFDEVMQMAVRNGYL